MTRSDTDHKASRMIARDEADLNVISAMMQDAVLRVGNIHYNDKHKRLTVEVNRFCWESVSKRGPHLRTRTLLAFDSVLNVKARAVTKTDPDMILSVLSIRFTSDDQPPGGTVRVLLAGDGELEIRVEALDVTLLDGGHQWLTRHTPDHGKMKC